MDRGYFRPVSAATLVIGGLAVPRMQPFASFLSGRAGAMANVPPDMAQKFWDWMPNGFLIGAGSLLLIWHFLAKNKKN